jgi:hypothetical protein
MREGFSASQGARRDKRIIIAHGNPPYDPFAGAAQADEAAAVTGQGRLDQLAAQPLQALEGDTLVALHELSVADHVRCQG